MSKENDALSKAVDQINKKFGKNKVIIIGNEPKEKAPTISSGSIAVNYALGGGYAEGRIIELFGGEGSGKTTLTLHAIAESQMSGKSVAFIDMEHALNLEYASDLGVNVESLIFSQPDNGEEAFSIMEELIRAGIEVIVLDSVAAMVPLAELEGEYGESKMGLMARMMSQGMRKINGLASKNKATLLFINQTRVKLGVMFGDPTTTTGGEALKFYASQRLHVLASSKVKDKDGEIVGNKVIVKVIKNKVFPPHKKTEFDLIFGAGIDKLKEVIDIAVALDVIKKSGSWYSYESHKLGQGEPAVKELLEDNPELLQEIKTKIGI